MRAGYQSVDSLRREDSFEAVLPAQFSHEQQQQTRRAAAVLVQALKGRRSDLARDCSLAQFRAHRRKIMNERD